MGTKMKGIYKGFKYTISQIFVVKEREMEIGYPTDVKHVAHIGWDGPSGSAPSWMNEFKTGPNVTTTSIGNSLSTWSSQDLSESMRQQSIGSDRFMNTMQSPEPNNSSSSAKKKHKHKKNNKSSSSPKSGSCSSSRSSRLFKPKFQFGQDNPKPANILQVS